MFNIPSDPWYHYMQPFRIALLKQIIKAHQSAEKQKIPAQQVQEEKSENAPTNP